MAAPARSVRWPRLAAWALCLPLLLPIAFLFAGWSEPVPEIWEHLRGYVLADVTANTLLLAIGLVIGTSTLGIGLGWLSACCEYPGRRWLQWALVLPLALPGYVVAFAYVGVFDYAGPLQSTWRAITGSYAALPGVRNLPGAVAMLSLVLYPYVYLLARGAFVRQGASAFNAARSLGHGPLAAFVRVAVPLARPAWIAGLVLALLEALADFGTVSILGVDTYTTAIYKTWFGFYSLPAAAQLATLLLGLVALALAIERALRGRARFAQKTAKPMPRMPLSRGRGIAVCTLQCAVLALGFVLPVAQLVAWASAVSPQTANIVSVVGNTLAIGALVSLVVVALALMMSAAERHAAGDRLVRAPIFIANLGYAVPGTVLAVATMLMLVRSERWLAQNVGVEWSLSIGLGGLLLALAIRFVRVGHGAVDAGFAQLRPSVMEAACALGASRQRRWWRITLPLLRPSLATALLLVLVETMKEMPATLMLRPFGWDTLAVRIYANTAEGLWQNAAWPALVLVGVGLVPVWLLVRHQR